MTIADQREEENRRRLADERLRIARELHDTLAHSLVAINVRAGASGFLLKGGEPADLVQAIRIAAASDSLLAPSVTRRLIQTYVSRPQPHAKTCDDGISELTTRERASG